MYKGPVLWDTTVCALLHVPSIIVSSDYNIQETIKLYETDLHDSCVVDQELKLWKRKWIDCLEKDRPDSLGAAILECDEERFLKCISSHQNWMHYTYYKLHL